MEQKLAFLISGKYTPSFRRGVLQSLGWSKPTIALTFEEMGEHVDLLKKSRFVDYRGFEVPMFSEVKIDVSEI